MAAEIPITGSPVPAKPSLRRAAVPSWTPQAWGAIATVALVLGVNCWWLTKNSSIPVNDAGRHLGFAFYAFEELEAGHIVHALTLSIPYPPFAYMVGDLGILFGGIAVAPPIIAENFVFVPLLALGCYHVARMAFNRTAGMLAVVFALGSPQITGHFHTFLLDAPETAMVAVALWPILATDGFSRSGVSALAGLAVGLGMLTKEPFVFYAAGPVAVTAIRGGPKAWRGMLTFAIIALAIALPWYVYEFAQVKALVSAAVGEAGNPGRGSDVAPSLLSIGNLEWYVWNIANSQLYAPLFISCAIGWLWTMVGFVRRRPVSRFAAELAIGAFVAWLAITETFIRDPRYSMPLLVYLAVFGVGWIMRVSRAARAAAVTALGIVGMINVTGISFGVARTVSLELPGAHPNLLQHPGVLTFYTDGRDSLGTGPHTDGDMLGTLRALRRNGVVSIVLEGSTSADEAFSAPGMFVLDGIAGLGTVFDNRVSSASLTRRYASLRNGPIRTGETPPCVRLDNGTGVWIRLGDPYAAGARDYCPSRRPALYG